MSESACQGLQSCLVEPPHALHLKLAPSFPNPSPVTISGHGTEDSAWLRSCFFQSSPDTSSYVDAKAPEYVHPLTKRRWSMLSEKSLEMCTESLGSETGTHVGEYYVSPATVHNKVTKPRTKKLNRDQSFPPPLKSAGLQVIGRREGGRLVLEAVTVAEWKNVFYVERSEGRIKVEMMRDSEETSVEEETVDDVEVTEVDDSGVIISAEGEDMEGNIGMVEGELGTDSFGRRRRCMESKRRSNGGFLKLNWERFLVTT